MSPRSRGTAGSEEPLVLLHGLGSSRRAWVPVLEALERRHEVLALDLPGFGKAPPLPADVVPSVHALADAVEREMDAAGFAGAHLAGNSLGGWIALELARRGRAKTVVAISPAGGGNERERAYARTLMKAIWRAARLGAPIAGAVAIPGPTRIVLFGTFFARPNRIPRDEAAYALRVYAGAPGFRDTCDWLFANRAQDLEAIDCPVTIGWGSRDVLLFPRQARPFLAQIPGARLANLDRLGHTPMSDDPERVSALILAQTSRASHPPADQVSPPFGDHDRGGVGIPARDERHD